MDRNSVIAFLGKDWDSMQALIFKALGSDVPMLDEINRRLLENAGKMLRPRLTMLFARICGGPVLTEESLRYAAAVEVLHNATLLHDDVADEAMTRRGKPTVMSYLGAVPAVLVGDFWLARAVGLLSDCSDMKWTLDAFTRFALGALLNMVGCVGGDGAIGIHLRRIDDNAAIAVGRHTGDDDSLFESVRQRLELLCLSGEFFRIRRYLLLQVVDVVLIVGTTHESHA